MKYKIYFEGNLIIDGKCNDLTHNEIQAIVNEKFNNAGFTFTRLRLRKLE